MNLLPIILGILFVLSWGSIAIHESHLSFRKLQKTFHFLMTAERSCHQKSQLQSFHQLSGTLTQPIKDKKKASEPATKRIRKIPEINPICARINLHPLFRDGTEAHPQLVKCTKTTLKTLYSSAVSAEVLEKLFEAMISAAKSTKNKNRELSLETLSLKDPELQKIYYKLLKGMKRPDLFKSTHFPPLTDHFKIEGGACKICVLHAHPHALIPFFGKEGALKIFEHIGENPKQWVTMDELLLAAQNPSVQILSEDQWTLLNLVHTGDQPPLTGSVSSEEGEISIRRPS